MDGIFIIKFSFVSIINGELFLRKSFPFFDTQKKHLCKQCNSLLHRWWLFFAKIIKEEQKNIHRKKCFIFGIMYIRTSLLCRLKYCEIELRTHFSCDWVARSPKRLLLSSLLHFFLLRIICSQKGIAKRSPN